MNCALCEKPIANYATQFHHLKINDIRAVDICSDCTTIFSAWHAKNIATLFPTTMMKKRYENTRR